MVLVIRDASLALSPLLHQNKNDGGEREKFQMRGETGNHLEGGTAVPKPRKGVSSAEGSGMLRGGVG